MTFFSTFVTFAAVLVICVLLMGISYFIRGKSRIECKRCGYDPTEAKTSCNLCGKPPKKK